jgi:hypothetical protein
MHNYFGLLKKLKLRQHAAEAPKNEIETHLVIHGAFGNLGHRIGEIIAQCRNWGSRRERERENCPKPAVLICSLSLSLSLSLSSQSVSLKKTNCLTCEVSQLDFRAQSHQTWPPPGHTHAAEGQFFKRPIFRTLLLMHETRAKREINAV